MINKVSGMIFHIQKQLIRLSNGYFIVNINTNMSPRGRTALEQSVDHCHLHVLLLGFKKKMYLNNYLVS